MPELWNDCLSRLLGVHDPARASAYREAARQIGGISDLGEALVKRGVAPRELVAEIRRQVSPWSCPRCGVLLVSTSAAGDGSEAQCPACGSAVGVPKSLARIGRYELLKAIGRGGLGVVYRARNIEDGQIVALKVIRPEKVGDWSTRRRFLREIKLTSRLDHPAIVRVLDSGDHEDGVFIVMELVEGETLYRVLRRGPMHTIEVLEIAYELAGALAHAHERGVIHRDLKPGNVIIGKDGRPKLLDLGLARDTLHPESTAITATGLSVGTPGFIPPERIELTVSDRGSGDIWALGVLLYQALLGQPPFSGRTIASVMEAVLSQEPSWEPGDRWTALAEGPQLVIAACLLKDPSLRYKTMEALREDLQRLIKGVPIEELEACELHNFIQRRADRWRLLQRVLIGVGAVGALVALGAWLAMGG